MKIERIFNNNVVVVKENDVEKVIFGTGIGFKQKVGNVADQNLIQKSFVLENESIKDMQSLFQRISAELIELVVNFVFDYRKKMKVELSDSIYLSLSDHLHFAIQRNMDNLPIKNPLNNEIKYLYSDEYILCLNYIHRINTVFNTNLEDDEASSIVLHFLNAQRDEDMFSDIMKETKVVKDILDIVRLEYGVEYDKYSISFKRFIIHLQYFSKRILNNETVFSEDLSLMNLIKTNYQREVKCVEKISKYILDEYAKEISSDEFVYLTIHIKKVNEKIKGV